MIGNSNMFEDAFYSAKKAHIDDVDATALGSLRLSLTMKIAFLLMISWSSIAAQANFSRDGPLLYCYPRALQTLDVCLNQNLDGDTLGLGADEAILGHGLSGVVRLFNTSIQDSPLAVKTSLLADNHDTEHEFNIAIRLSGHPNIVATYDLFTDGEFMHQVMEFVPFRLQDLVAGGILDQEQIGCSFAQIIEGVAYMHDLGIAHLDLKMSNILVSEEGRVKLIDFGSSVVCRVSESDINQEDYITGKHLLHY